MLPLTSNNFGPTISIGEILVDIVANKPGKGFTTSMDLTGPYPSGAPSIFINQCARLGGSAGMIGAVGNDDFGQMNIQRLKNDGVDISAIRIDPDHPTGSAFVRYDIDGSRDFVFNIEHSAATKIMWSESVDTLINKARHLHIMGTALMTDSLGELIIKAVLNIKQRGGSISLDPNLRKELAITPAAANRFQIILEQCDLLLPSGDELLTAVNARTVSEALINLFKIGIKEIVLKKGSKGAVVFLPDGTTHQIKALKVNEIDPTGAGDCFGGAYVTCRRLGMSIDNSLKYANAAGARNVTVVGPMEGTATFADLDEFINKNSEVCK